jgi:hypothetical protein
LQHCNPEGAEIPFDNILDRLTGSDPKVTDYMSAPTRAALLALASSFLPSEVLITAVRLDLE